MKARENPDFTIRLPADKKKLKPRLIAVAKKNEISLNKLIVSILEWFLEERKDREFTIKLR